MHLKKLKELDLEQFIQRDIELCPQCGGKGFNVHQVTGFPKDSPQEVICDVCEGSGRVIKEHIDVCSYVPYKG